MSSEERKVPYIFEMPVDRLLSEEEIISLIANGFNLSLVTCDYCGVEGWSTDHRNICYFSHMFCRSPFFVP